MENSSPEDSAARQPRWQPVSATDRRVLGVLIEKAKTTPDQYPLSLNALRTGCNQKSNRFPSMELEEEPLQASLDRLRALGAVTLVQGGSRVERFRHLLYEWFMVDKRELAVLAELLLRGAQTEGELRTRASRMEPINDLPALRSLLDQLRAKKLVVSLTREGRGHVITHNLYRPDELEKLRRQHADHDVGEEQETTTEAVVPARPASAPLRPAMNQSAQASAAPPTPVQSNTSDRSVADLRAELASTRERVEELAAEVEACRDELRQLKESLGA